jgi:Na+/H+ antiporter NhaA
MSMFISTLAYRDYPELHLTANAGILLASVTAAVVGFAYFTLLEWFRNRP